MRGKGLDSMFQSFRSIFSFRSSNTAHSNGDVTTGSWTRRAASNIKLIPKTSTESGAELRDYPGGWVKMNQDRGSNHTAVEFVQLEERSRLEGPNSINVTKAVDVSTV